MQLITGAVELHSPSQDLSFKILFDSMPDALLLVNEGGHIVKANPPAQLLLGYSIDAIIGLEVELLIPERYREHHRHYRGLA